MKKTWPILVLSVIAVTCIAATYTITQLTSNTNPGNSTLLEIYDPAATPKSGKYLLTNLVKSTFVGVTNAFGIFTGNTDQFVNGAGALASLTFAQATNAFGVFTGDTAKFLNGAGALATPVDTTANWTASGTNATLNTGNASVGYGITSATVTGTNSGTFGSLTVNSNATVTGTVTTYSLAATNLVFQKVRIIRQALTHAGGTVTLNMATNVPGYASLTLTGAVTFASSGLVDGSQYDLLFFSSGASNTITWGPEFRFPSFKPSYISATNSAGQATIGRLWAEANGTNLICTYAEEQ